MPMLPLAEWRPDVSDLNGQHTRLLRNVVPRGDGYGPWKDIETLTAALPAKCRGYFVAQKTDSTVQIFAGTATKLYSLDNSDMTWDDVSLGAGTYSTLDDNANWSFVQFGSRVIASQKNAVMQTWTLGSSSAFANLAGSPPQAGWISVVGRFVVAADLNSAPYRIHWSALNDPTGWTAGTASSDTQDMPDGGRVRAVVEASGDVGLIVQERAMRRMVWTPNGDFVFQIDRMPNAPGCVIPWSFVCGQGGVYYYSTRGFVQITADGALSPIGKEIVDRTIEGSHPSTAPGAVRDLAYDSAQPQLFQGSADITGSRILWVYKSVASGTALFDKGVVYDTALQRWSPVEVTGEFIASLSRPGITLENLDSISSSLDALTTSLDGFSASALPALGVVNSAHKLCTFTGASLESEVETSEQAAGGRRLYINGVRPITDATSAFAAVSKRENLNEAATEGDESEMDSDGNCPVLEETRYGRAKIRIPAGTAWSFVTGAEADTGPAGWF